MAAEVLGRQRLLEPGQIERLVVRARGGSLPPTVKAWLASTMISKPGPTASRTAASRAMSSLTCGRPTLILAPRKPCALPASASSTIACGSTCSQPPSVE